MSPIIVGNLSLVVGGSGGTDLDFHSLILAMQFAVVALLAAVCFQASGAFKGSPFPLIGFGWIVNLFYLLSVSEVASVALPFLEPLRSYSSLHDSFDLVSSGIFCWAGIQGLKASRYARIPGFRLFLSMSRRAFLVLVAGLVVWNEFFLHAWPEDSKVGFFFSAIPVVSLGFFSRVSLALYFSVLLGELSYKRAGLNPLVLAMLLYSFIQPLHLLMMLQKPRISPDDLGFAVGFVSKIIILTGIIQLLVLKTAALARNLEDQRQFERRRQAVRQVGHELGTPVNEILYHVSRLSDTLPKRGLATTYLAAVENAALRMAAILDASRIVHFEELPALGRATPQAFELLRRQVINVNTLIQIAVMAVKATRPEKVRYKIEYAKNCCIRCSPGDLVQVLVNILRNSYDALPNGEGRIVIKTETQKAGDATTLGDDAKVRIFIQDDGEGVHSSSMSKIFEEGFSTRGGLNRGHGLFVVRKLVAENGGDIKMVSPVNAANIGRRGSETLLEFTKVNCTEV